MLQCIHLTPTCVGQSHAYWRAAGENTYIVTLAGFDHERSCNNLFINQPPSLQLILNNHSTCKTHQRLQRQYYRPGPGPGLHRSQVRRRLDSTPHSTTAQSTMVRASFQARLPASLARSRHLGTSNTFGNHRRNSSGAYPEQKLTIPSYSLSAFCFYELYSNHSVLVTRVPSPSSISEPTLNRYVEITIIHWHAPPLLDSTPSSPQANH